MIEKLVIAGANINDKNNDDNTVAWIFIQSGHVDNNLTVLCRLGANLNIINKRGDVPLIYWIQKGNLEVYSIPVILNI